MASLELLLKAIDAAHWEMGEAFEGRPDADVWRRPDPRLLSVGELASHVACWEAHTFLGEGAVDSPLVLPAARYYTSNSTEPFELPLGAGAVLEEVRRIHALGKAAFVAEPRDSEDPNPHREGSWGFTLEYQAFHVAYHTGQMDSVRHLLGHRTVDNWSARRDALEGNDAEGRAGPIQRGRVGDDQRHALLRHADGL